MAGREDCILAAVRAGATAEDAASIVDDMLREAQTMKAQGQLAGLEKALAERTMNKAEAMRRAALQERRQAAITIVKRDAARQFIQQAKDSGASFADAVEAMLVGSAKRFAGSRESVSRLRSSLRGLWGGSLANELERAGVVDLLQKDHSFGESAMREMIEPGSTGDDLARATADIFSRYLEDFRQRLNEAGADIGKLDNYAPQSHDSLKIRKAGQLEWIRFIEDKIDWQRTLPDADGPFLHQQDARRDFLYEVWQDITTGMRNKERPGTPPSAFRPRNIANSLHKERVLHFRNADAAIEYQRTFGQGNIVHAMLNRLDSSAAKLALMEKFGPNPEAVIRGLIDEEALNMRKAGMADPEKVRNLWKGERSGRIANYYMALSGEMGTPENLTGARVSAAIRGLSSMAKLGGAFLSSFADTFIKAAALRHSGVNMLESWQQGLEMRFESLQGTEKRELGRQLGVYTQGLLGDLYSRFDVNDALPGRMTRWMNSFFKLSGLTGWTEAHRAAYTFNLSNRLARQLEEGDFSRVNKDYAVVLERNGLKDRWNLLQKMVQQSEDGERYVIPENAYRLSEADLEAFLPEHLRDYDFYARQEKEWRTQRRRFRGKRLRNEVPPGTRSPQRPNAPAPDEWQTMRSREAERIRRKLAEDVMGYFSDETGYAVLEPDAKTRAAMYRNTRPGTVAGEMLRFAWQFKSYPVTYWQRIVSESRWQSASSLPEGGFSSWHDARRFTGDVPGMIHFTLAAVALGYVSGAAKDIAKGREPRDATKLETWMAAITQSGGLGILGDFLLGTTDRFGGQAAGSLLGPVLSSGSRLLPITGQLARGEFGDAGADAVRWTVDNAPFVNLWYTRGALDYLLFFHLREALSPGTLQRAERKLKEEFNQGYFKIGGLDLTPSHNIRKGGGFRSGMSGVYGF